MPLPSFKNPVESCPQTKMVLGGYSQGAAVVDILTAMARPILGFTSPLQSVIDELIWRRLDDHKYR